MITSSHYNAGVRMTQNYAKNVPMSQTARLICVTIISREVVALCSLRQSISGIENRNGTNFSFEIGLLIELKAQHASNMERLVYLSVNIILVVNIINGSGLMHGNVAYQPIGYHSRH